MTWSEGWALRAETHRVKGAAAFAVALSVAVLLTWLGRLTRWAIREGCYRPHVGLTVAMSTLTAFWAGPVVAASVLVTAALGWLVWEVKRFGRASSTPSPSVGPILFYLSRAWLRAWRLRRKWRDYVAPNLKLVDGLTGKPCRTRRWRVHSSVRSTCVVNVTGAWEHIDDDIAPQMAKVAQSLGLHSATVEPVHNKPGLALFTWYWGSPLLEVQPLERLPEPRPGWAWFGLGADGQPAGIRLDLSALFVGESRSGKSTSMWACALSTLEQAQMGGDPVEFWVVDLALTEFASMRRATVDDRDQFQTANLNGHRYATTQKQANALMRMLWNEAERRAATMRDDEDRKLDPTDDMPRIVLIIDELLRVTDRHGSKDAAADGAEATGKLKQILTQFAKFGITVWGGTQASQVAVLTYIRDWFQQRVAFSTSTASMTDTALYQGSAAAGAACHTLSVYRDAGRGWMKRDGHSGVFPFRAVWVNDHDVRDIGRGRVPDRLLAARGQQLRREKNPGAVYIMWGFPDDNDERECLYVGMTDAPRPEVRWRRHVTGVNQKEWADQVEYTEVRDAGSERKAVRLERRMIRELNPVHNKRRYERETEYERTGVAR